MSGDKMDKETLERLFREGILTIGITDESVSSKEGTGIVHIAPGHGENDYKIWMRYLNERR